jgi:PAS domain S-box-containing protein
VWLIAGLLLSVALLFAASWEANRQEHMRMDAFRSRVADLAKISQGIIIEQLRQFDDVLLVLRRVYAADPKRFIKSIGLLRNGPLKDREILVVLVDRDGYLAYTDATTAKPGLSLGYRAYFRYFADGGKDRFYVDEPIFGRTTQRHSVPLVRPIYDKKGAFLGVIALSVRQESLANFGTRLQLSDDTAVTLITHSGSVAGRSRDLAKMQGKIIPQEMLAPMLKGTEGVFSSRVIPDGVERVVAYRHIHEGDTPLIVYVEASPANALRETSQQRFVLIGGASFISLVIMVLIAVYLKGRKTAARLIDTLRRSKEQEYATLTQASLDGFWITDNTGRILDTNDTFCKMLGYTREELLCLSIRDFEAVESPEKIADHIRTVREAGSNRFQSRYRCKDGTIIDVEISAQYVKESGGRFFVFARDITDRKRKEDALKENAQRLELAQYVAKSGIWDWDVVNGHIEWSGQMFNLFGLDPQKSIASFESWRSALHPEDLEIAGQKIDKALKERIQLNSDYRILLPDGQIRWINAVGKGEYDIQGRPVRMLGVCSDITERKQTEAALRQQTEEIRVRNDELELFNRAATGRELRMIELKQEINELCRRLGEPPRHATDPLQTDSLPGAGPAPLGK